MKYHVIDIIEVTRGTTSWDVPSSLRENLLLLLHLYILLVKIVPILPILIIVIAVKLFVPEDIATLHPIHLLILVGKALVDVDACDSFYCREEKHAVEAGQSQLRLIDTFLDDSTIVSIPDKHHHFDAAAKADYHDLTVVHCSVAQVVDI